MVDEDTTSAPPQSALPIGFQLLFPNQRDYAVAWLSKAPSADGGTMFIWNDQDELSRVAEEVSGPGPSLLDQKSGLDALGADVARNLQGKELIVIRQMREIYPRLDGEQLLSDSVTVLAQKWGDVPASAIAYVRTTNLGRMVVVDGSRIVATDTGAINFSFPQPQPMAVAIEPTITLMAYSNAMSTVNAAISALEMVAFACGPQGMVVGAGLAVVQFILGLFGGKSNPPDLPKEINDLLVQDFANDHVKTDLAVIVGYSNWLSNQDPDAISGTLDDDSLKKYADALSELKQYVVNACDPGSQLLTAVSNLRNGTYTSDPPFSVLGLPAFLLGASLHLTFERARLLFSTDGTTFRSPLAYNIVNAAQDYLNYLDDTVKSIDDSISARLGGISAVQQGNFYESAGRGGVDRRYAYVTDSQAANFPTQKVLIPSTGGASSGYAKNVVNYTVCFPKDCSGNGRCDSGDLNPINKWQGKYVSNVTSKLQDKYNVKGDRRTELTNARAALQKVVDTYKQAAPPKS